MRGIVVVFAMRDLRRVLRASRRCRPARVTTLPASSFLAAVRRRRYLLRLSIRARQFAMVVAEGMEEEEEEEVKYVKKGVPICEGCEGGAVVQYVLYQRKSEWL